MKRLLGVAAVVLVLLGGCGDDDGDAADTTTTTEDDTTTTTEATDDDADTDGGVDEDDQAIAEAALLSEADFPAGWTAEPRDEDDDEGPDADDCAPLAPYEDMQTAKASSDQFERDEAQINLTVVLLPDEDDASSYVEDFASDETNECLQELLREAITEELDSGADDGSGEPGPTSEDFDVEITSEPSQADGFGDDAAGYRITMAITAQDTVELHGEFLVVQVGRALAQFSFLDVATPITEPRDELIDLTVERLEEAL